MFRSVLSIFTGIVVLTVTSFAIEAALNPLLLRAFPHSLGGPEALRENLWVRTLTFSYGLMCVAAGGYVTGRIARRFPLRHAAALGAVQFALTLAAMQSSLAYHASRSQWIATALLSFPAALGGGILYTRRKERVP
jgi:hypothetical protein